MSETKEAFLSRWSRLKLETPKLETGEVAQPAEPDPVAAPVPPTADALSSQESPLPPMESVTVQSDFRPYLQATVDAGLKRMALKKLFQDPHFHFANMDKLDIYIDDYSIADPLPEGMLEQLKFAQDYIFKDPTKSEADSAVSVKDDVVVAGAADAADAVKVQQEPLDGVTDSLDNMSHIKSKAPSDDNNE